MFALCFVKIPVRADDMIETLWAKATAHANQFAR